MARYIDDDAKIAAYVAVPHQGITPQFVGRIRRLELAAGRLTTPHMIASSAADMEPLEMTCVEKREQGRIIDASAKLADAIRRIHA